MKINQQFYPPQKILGVIVRRSKNMNLGWLNPSYQGTSPNGFFMLTPLWLMSFVFFCEADKSYRFFFFYQKSLKRGIWCMCNKLKDYNFYKKDFNFCENYLINDQDKFPRKLCVIISWISPQFHKVKCCLPTLSPAMFPNTSIWLSPKGLPILSATSVDPNPAVFLALHV